MTFSTENWHSTYSCPRNVYTNFDFSTFFVFELRTGTGQTDGRARHLMWTVGRPHKHVIAYINVEKLPSVLFVVMFIIANCGPLAAVVSHLHFAVTIVTIVVKYF